ncbi:MULTISPECIES: S8 family peptidase [unclassified Streptomyces]|uniref:S8 family peptidase n=1 Tax=unclassified Streptomyces TaxID=2593676 RepID=UPI002E377FFE|nr:MULTISPECIES: S8 family peptidase [unclassified Streptomyces]WUC68417.1 S8 family peptidase [Streptomyces sp. NBC_00539]
MVIAATVVAAAAAAAVTSPANAALYPSDTLRTVGEPIAGRYLVVFKDGGVPSPDAARTTAAQGRQAEQATVASVAERLAKAHGGSVRTVFDTALHGYVAEMTPGQAQQVASDPAVESVERDSVQHSASAPEAAQAASVASWGLDRVDQRSLPLDGSYTAPNTASNVTVYLVDSGLRTTHSQFGGRAGIGVDLVGDGRNGGDCVGHGTHVAGTVGGKDYGVAKGVRLVSVRVTPCNDSIPTSAIVSAADWITKRAVKPAVVNMSINGGVSAAEDKAIRNSIASGVTWVVSSGNSGADACRNSPGDIGEAIVVNNSTSGDQRRSDSNWGACTDLFAPGTGITSAWNSGDKDSHKLTGTSMAAPHVAGAAAIYLSAHPTATPAQVQDALIKAATTGKIGNAGTNTPNRLLYIAGLGDNPTK